jgi:sugar lactone lactonase YvrE
MNIRPGRAAFALVGVGIAAGARAADLLVSGLFLGQVLRFDGTGAFVSSFATGGSLLYPSGLVFTPDGRLLVGDAGAGLIHAFNGSTGAALGVLVPAFSGGLDTAEGLAIGPDGALYVSNHLTAGQVLRFNATTGEFIDVFAAGSGLSEPTDLEFRSGLLYVSSGGSNQVLTFDAVTGLFNGSIGSGAVLSFPTGLAFGPDGHLYVANYFTNTVARFHGPSGSFMGEFVPGGSGVFAPSDIDFGPDGHLYVTSSSTAEVYRFNGSTGAPMGVFASGGGLHSPWYLLFMDSPCYPDCNGSGTLTVADFGCFQTKFVAGDPYADCNGDGQRTVADFGCFQTKFVQGCP